MRVEYNPENRPGYINKKVRVYVDYSEDPINLKITGNVIGTPNKLRKKIGFLALKSSYFRFDQLKDTEIGTDSLEVQNKGEMTITFNFSDLPDYVEMKAFPSTLEPQERGYVLINYNARLRNDYGYLIDKIPFEYLYGNRKITGSLTLSTTISEDFSQLSAEELKKAARLELDNPYYDLGKIKVFSEKMCTYNLVNSGGSDLVIRSIKVPYDCRLVKYDKWITPGGRGSITIGATSRKVFPNYKKSIDLITNDPEKPHQVLIIHGEIIE